LEKSPDQSGDALSSAYDRAECRNSKGNECQNQDFHNLFLTGCFTAFFACHWLPGEKFIKPVVQSSNVFPTTFEGFEIKKLPLSERESYFLEDFPDISGVSVTGNVKSLSGMCGSNAEIASGKRLFPSHRLLNKTFASQVDEEGKRWSCFTAVKAGESYVFAREFTTSKAMNGQMFPPGIGQHLASRRRMVGGNCCRKK
jgi:hypothetical protein